MRDWRKVSHKLNNMPKRKCNQRSGVVKCPELEKKLVEWVLQNRECGYCVTRDAIRMQALKYAKMDKIMDFKANVGWCTRFMMRHGLTIRQAGRILTSQMCVLAYKSTP